MKYIVLTELNSICSIAYCRWTGKTTEGELFSAGYLNGSWEIYTFIDGVRTKIATGYVQLNEIVPDFEAIKWLARDSVTIYNNSIEALASQGREK